MRLLRMFFAAAILNYESTVMTQSGCSLGKKVAPNEKSRATDTNKSKSHV